MESVAPVVQVRLEPAGTTGAAHRRTLEALEATARFASHTGALDRLDFEGRGDDPNDLVLTLPVGGYPAPSMLAELLGAISNLQAEAVEARQIPFSGSAGFCRLTRGGGTSSSLPVPSAVVFRDGRPEPEAVLPTSGGPLSTPFLGVVMRTQGRRLANLEEALTCLAAQTVDDFEVHLAFHHKDPGMMVPVHDLVARFPETFQKRIDLFSVVGGGRARPLNAGLDRVRARYVAFLDDDDLVTADWVEAFLTGAREAPGAVVRSSSVNQRIARPDTDNRAPYVEVGPPEPVFAARFDLLEHLRDNSTPIFSFAVPRALVGEVRFCEELPVLEDWDFLLHMALAGGVHDTGRVTGVYHWWLSGESALDQTGARGWQEARRQVLERLDEAPLVLPGGNAGRLVAMMDDLAAVTGQLEVCRVAQEEARGEIDAMRRTLAWRAITRFRRLLARAHRLGRR